jgi:hypothetical protein
MFDSCQECQQRRHTIVRRDHLQRIQILLPCVPDLPCRLVDSTSGCANSVDRLMREVGRAQQQEPRGWRDAVASCRETAQRKMRQSVVSCQSTCPTGQLLLAFGKVTPGCGPRRDKRTGTDKDAPQGSGSATRESSTIFFRPYPCFRLVYVFPII